MGESWLDQSPLPLVDHVGLDSGAELRSGWTPASSSSKIPARARTISASAQYATPSP